MHIEPEDHTTFQSLLIHDAGLVIARKSGNHILQQHHAQGLEEVLRAHKANRNARYGPNVDIDLGIF